MAGEADSSAQVDPQLVGNSFVEQFYKALHQYPEHLHRFYQDSSILGRPAPDGVMTLVTTMKGINDQILALNYQNYHTEMLTVDAQGSYCSGVLVVVNGYLIGKETGKRKFSQSFFLAPQENGFYVLNDVFRFVDDNISVGLPIADIVEELDPPISPPSVSDFEPDHVLTQSVQNLTTRTPTSSPEVIANNDNEIIITETLDQNHVPDHRPIPNNQTTTCSSEVIITSNAKPEIATHDHIQNDEVSFLHKKQSVAAVDHHPAFVLNQNGTRTVSEINNPWTLDAGSRNNNPWTLDAGSRKSFASIVHALKDNSSPFQIKVPPPSFRKPNATRGTKAADPINNNDDQAKINTVIFVANLPMDVTVDQVKQIFSKFGPIKINGIRIRNNQINPNCFSFVEFESVSSMHNALQASPIEFGDRKVYIEEKKGGNEIVNVRRNVVAGSQSDNLRSRVNSNAQAAAVAAPAAATTTRCTAGESPRSNQNDGGRGQKVNQSTGSRGARQGHVEKKNTGSAMSSKKAARAANK